MEESKLSLCYEKGVYAAVGEFVETTAKKYLPFVPVEAVNQQLARDNNHYHVTIFTPDELSLLESQSKRPSKILDTSDIALFDFGLAHLQKGSNTQSWYIVIFSPFLQKLRAEFGLPEKQLHITIGFYGQDLYADITTDLHTCLTPTCNLISSRIACIQYIIQNVPYRKLLSSLAEGNSPFSLLTYRQEKFLLTTVTYQLMDEGSHEHNSLFESDRLQILRDIGKFIFQLRNSPKHGLLMKREYQQLLEDIAWYLLPKGIFFGVRMVILSQLEDQKSVNYDLLLNYFPLTINAHQVQNVTQFVEHVIELNKIILSTLTKQAKVYNKMIIVVKRANGSNDFVLDFASVPRNFSFVSLPAINSLATLSKYKQVLAGSAYPSSVEALLSLYFCGIRHIFTIHEEAIDSELEHTVNHIIGQLYLTTNATTSTTTKKGKQTKPTGEVSVSGNMKYLKLHFWCVNDRTSPSTIQMKEIIREMHGAVVTLEESILVHCQGGVGRTNTVIIAYLMLFQDISYAEAFDQVVNQRKITLATSQQEFLRRWYQVLREDSNLIGFRDEIMELSHGIATHATIPPGMKAGFSTATASKRSVESYQAISATLKMPPLIMMVGVPASGKSTFSQAMVQAFPEYFVRVNRDEMRGKGECEMALHQNLEPFLKQQRTFKTKTKGSFPTPQRVVLLDNCNLQVSKRKEWLDAAHQVPCWCIFFQRPVEECKERIQVREQHPTIPPGKSGLKIIDSMLKQLEVPQTKEGFEQIFTITSDEEMEALLQLWRIPFQKPGNDNIEDVSYEKEIENEVESADQLLSSSSAIATNPALAHAKPVKFPKIPHLVNLGAATRDDKILSPQDVKTWIQANHQVIIEEKIDGANIGIWIYAEEEDKDGASTTNTEKGGKRYKNYQIMIQNRSHYINQYYHKQFEKIHLWLEQHKYELYDLLTPNETILYGEWVYAKHSISYNQLPDYFIAYDLYQISTNTFLPRDQFTVEIATKATTIMTVPILFEGKVASLQEIVAWVDGPSQYSTTDNREGIVIRIHSTGNNSIPVVRDKKQSMVEGKGSGEVMENQGKTTLLMKCKIVREHFCAGNERWNRSDMLQLNTLAKKNLR